MKIPNSKNTVDTHFAIQAQIYYQFINQENCMLKPFILINTTKIIRFVSSRLLHWMSVVGYKFSIKKFMINYITWRKSWQYATCILILIQMPLFWSMVTESPESNYSCIKMHDMLYLNFPLQVLWRFEDKFSMVLLIYVWIHVRVHGWVRWCCSRPSPVPSHWHSHVPRFLVIT